MDNPRVVINRTVLLECPVDGIPPPKVKWMKNGSPLHPLPAHFSLLENGRHLEIASAQVSDTSRYTCIATNEAGELQRTFDLEVLGESNSVFASTPLNLMKINCLKCRVVKFSLY